jgi:hypothetical protein
MVMRLAAGQSGAARRRRLARLAGRAIGAIGAALCLTAARRHPLHTTIAEVTYDPATHAVTAVIRIFSDDLARAVRSRGGVPDDAGAVAYVRSAFTIVTPDGRALSLGSCGVRTTGDLRWICLRAPVPAGLRGARVLDAVLTDVYADQVNVVTTNDGDRHDSLLFTRGDRPKAVTS